MANTPNNPQFGTGTSRMSGGMEGSQQSGGSMADKAKDTMSSLTDQAKSMATNLGDRAQEAATTVTHRAQEYAQAAGHRLSEAAGNVSDTWRHGRDYISEQGFSGLAEDMTDLIRRNPIPALLVGFGLGFLLARTMRD